MIHFTKRAKQIDRDLMHAGGNFVEKKGFGLSPLPTYCWNKQWFCIASDTIRTGDSLTASPSR